MIVRGLRAEGFMRYRLLELEELPRGVIAVVGENEAGKSSLGEAVAFSLFGRTVRTEETDPTLAIHWDHEACTTAIEVEVAGRGVHRVERRVSRAGDLEARLTGPGGELLAEGPREVGEALRRLLGLDFPTFRYSFYVAQGELDLVQRDGQDNARRVVSDMLGVTTVERARARLEDGLVELRQRVDMLERDLIVARALHTEALPAGAEASTIEEEVAAARAALAHAEREEAQALGEARAAEELAAAARRRTTALGELEAALLVDAQRRRLLQAAAGLRVLDAAADAEQERLEGALTAAEQPLVQARARLAACEAVDAQARRLATLVSHRGHQLADEVAEDDQDALPARVAAAGDLAAREGRAATVATVLGSLLLLLALAGGGAAAGLLLPAEQPKLTLPISRLHSPRLGLELQPLTPKRVATAAGGLGGALLLAAIAFLVRGGRARGRRDAARLEAARLDGRLAAGRAERDACATFQVPALCALKDAAAPIHDPDVEAALSDLEQAAGELMSADEPPAALLAAARAQVSELEERAREAAPRLAEARRLTASVRAALAAAETTLQAAYPGGLPEAPAAPAAPPADALPAAIDEAVAAAARARVELEALEAGARAATPAEAARALREAIQAGLGAAAGKADALRARYEDQTGLPELLRARDVAPSADALRAVLERERELLAELLGAPDDLAAAREAAQELARAARVRRAEAQADRDEAEARQARAAQGRRRLDELAGRIAELEQALEPTRASLAEHEQAIELLGELATSLRKRFGPGIARYVELVLPRLTNGRYRRTRVGDDLDVRVFSPERGDFVRLVELSAGTADQVLIALRLGLARALIASRGLQGGHFLFLDEPLVSADAEREQAFFALLRTFDDEFAQIFVTSPRPLPEDGPFARQLVLTRDAAEVRLGVETPA